MSLWTRRPNRLITALLCGFFLGGPLRVRSETAPERQSATIQDDYHGNHTEEFPVLADHVRLLVQQAPLDIASKLGLVQYKPGFQYPLTIRFADRIHFSDTGEALEPGHRDSDPAYLRLYRSDGQYFQELIFNMEWYVDHRADFDRLFYHEMTHVMLNETLGAEASLDLPHWVSEGLAVYVAGNGVDLVREAVSKEVSAVRSEGVTEPDAMKHSLELRRFAVDLDGPFTAAALPTYYLAIQFIVDKKGVDTLQNFVRDLVDGDSVNDALKESIGLDTFAFEEQLKVYTQQVFDRTAATFY